MEGKPQGRIVSGQSVRLDEAASTILAAITADSARETEKILFDFLSENIDEVSEFVSLLYGKYILRPEHIMSALHRSIGMFPEEFELVDGEPLVPSLASESPPEVEGSMSIPEALDLVAALKDMQSPPDIRAVFKKMGRPDALVLWNRALGEKPLIPKYRMTRAFAHHLEDYTPQRLRLACAVEDMGTVLRRAYHGILPHKFHIEPGYAFKGPSYKQWRYWSVPFENTHYDIVSGPRHFAHSVQGRVLVFDRVGEPVKGVTSSFDTSADCVVEIDHSGEVIEWLHTADDPDMWMREREERAVNPTTIKDGDHLRALAQSLQEGEQMRLIDGDRAYFHSQHVGGFIMPRRVFEMPLLITATRLQKNREEDWVDLRIEALDGFDPVKVGIANVQRSRLPVVEAFHHLAHSWVDVDPPIIGQFHALNIEEGTLKGAYLVRIDTSLGFSDAMQYSDILERDHGPE